MGTVSDDIQKGLICQECGVWMPDVFGEVNSTVWNNPPGHPRTCPDCIEDRERESELQDE